MTSLTFDDAVTAGYLPSNQEYGVYYCDGDYANLEAVRARLPHATLFAITVFGRTGKGVFACDCELGDLTESQAVAWVEEQIRLDVDLICVYASADYWHNGLWAALEKYGPRIKRWCADYNGVKSTTVVYEGVTYQFDAHQYSSDARLDYDVAADGFFTPMPKAVTKKHKPKPKRKPSYHYERFSPRPRRLTRGINSPRNVVRNYDKSRKNLKQNMEKVQDIQANLRALLDLYEKDKIKSNHKAWCEGQLRARIGGGEVRPT